MNVLPKNTPMVMKNCLPYLFSGNYIGKNIFISATENDTIILRYYYSPRHLGFTLDCLAPTYNPIDIRKMSVKEFLSMEVYADIYDYDF